MGGEEQKSMLYSLSVKNFPALFSSNISLTFQIPSPVFELPEMDRVV